MPRINSPAELEAFRKDIVSQRDPDKPCIAVCTGTGCLALGAAKVVAALREEIKKQGLESKVDLKVDLRETGCPGFCERGPVIVIYPEEICYLQVQPGDAAEIISQTILGKKVIDRLLYVDPMTGEKSVRESEIPFYKNQMRLLIGNNIKLDPKSIEDYLALGGYSALAKALFQMKPEQVVELVKDSKLRGRGGAGFPAGSKWEFARNSPGETKYVVVNADEGDPGAFMDRALLEGNPHAVLEGFTIGAYAIGAHEGYIYVRQEYPLAVENVTIAIKQAEEHGLLGKNILGSGFDFTVKVHRGAGAFVCGEETALLRSLEGKPGEPKARPPYPGGERAVGQADQYQQRGDMGQHSADRQQRSRIPDRNRHGREQRNQDIFAGRQGEKYRPRGSAHGHYAERHYLSGRRRHPGGQEVQGGADGRSVGRLHPGTVSGYGSRL